MGISRLSLGARAGVLITLSAAIGCGSGGATAPPASVPECTGNVTVQVGTGTRPSISWTPACRAFLVVVELTSSSHDQWSIVSAGGNRIAPAITYGVLPDSAQLITPAAALTAGTSYTIAVRRYAGPNSDDGTLIGVATFTP